MKKLLALTIILLVGSLSITAKDSPIGKWLLAKVEVEGKAQELYSEIEFKEDGYIAMEGRVFGEWKHNKKSKTITIESEMIKEFAGERKIKKLNKKVLILTGPNVKMYFEKLNPEKILKDNTNSGLAGTWTAAMNDMKQVIIFELPKSIKIIESGDGMESTSGGEWIYNSDDKSLILMTRFNGLRGKVKVEKLTEKEFIISSNGSKVEASKLEKSETKIERLSFTSNDFYDDDGEPKYKNEISKLPWIGREHEMIISLEEVMSLTYTMSSLIAGTETFETKELIQGVSPNQSEDKITMDNIFIGYDRQTIPEDQEIPTVTLNLNEDNWEKNLYPFITTSYRVISQNEDITVGAGTYNCTSVEFMDGYEIKTKIWMINDIPGVIAKVIKENTDHFGDLEYSMYELKSINK